MKDLLEGCGLDARVTILGHIQRGGSPSAFDRYLATLQGIEAVKALLDSDPVTTPSIMIGIKENRITRMPLMECVKETRLCGQLMTDLCFTDALRLRGPLFNANYELVKNFYDLEEAQAAGTENCRNHLRIAIVNCGAPCGGINAANRAIILSCLFKGYIPVGVFNGFSGLIRGELKEMSPQDAPFHGEKGGSFLGINRCLPDEDLGLAAFYLQSFKIDGLIIIGGFEAFKAQLQMTRARAQYPAFDIPIVCIPATISNNVPGTEFSVGCDTALNIIVKSADSLKQSASSSRKRVFVVDVQGGHCGFLATMGGLAAGATCVYIPEEGIHLEDLVRDASHLRSRFSEDKCQGRLVLRNEVSSKLFSAEMIAKILEAESEGLFDARWASLGHLQQGGSPSPMDRIRATRLATLCVSFIESFYKQGGESTTDLCGPRRTVEDSSSVVIGIKGPDVVFSCCKKLQQESDMIYRRPLQQWWMEYLPLSKILAKYPSSE